jgi:hypothetical protein
VSWINRAWIGRSEDVRNWHRLESLSPHAQIVAHQADSAGIIEPTGKLLVDVAILLKTKALHAQAEPLVRRALAINESQENPNQSNIASCLNNLGPVVI